MLTLPSFQLLTASDDGSTSWKKQPDPPHVARTVAKNDVKNEHGALITFTVRESRNGKDWWVYATCQGLRMSNTLHTSVRAKAETWIHAVKTGEISIDREAEQS